MSAMQNHRPSCWTTGICKWCWPKQHACLGGISAITGLFEVSMSICLTRWPSWGVGLWSVHLPETQQGLFVDLNMHRTWTERQAQFLRGAAGTAAKNLRDEREAREWSTYCLTNWSSSSPLSGCVLQIITVHTAVRTGRACIAYTLTISCTCTLVQSHTQNHIKPHTVPCKPIDSSVVNSYQHSWMYEIYPTVPPGDLRAFWEATFIYDFLGGIYISVL